MNPVRDLRRRTGLTQAQLAAAAGTSQPTIAGYESGKKSPTLRTLTRIARAAGLEPFVVFVPAMTREDRRSLALHRAIADRLVESPRDVLEKAQRNLLLMQNRHPHAHSLLAEWGEILLKPVDEIAVALLDPSLRGRDLRKVTPFAGVLSAADRAKVYRQFARREVAA